MKIGLQVCRFSHAAVDLPARVYPVHTINDTINRRNPGWPVYSSVTEIVTALSVQLYVGASCRSIQHSQVHAMFIQPPCQVIVAFLSKVLATASFTKQCNLC